MCCGLVNEAGKAAVDFYGPKCDNMRNMNGRYVMSNIMKGTRSKGSRMGWRGMTIAGILCTFAHAGGTAWADTVPAWRNTVDAKAAEETMRAYTSSVIRCEWAGENPNVERFIPANMAFQFAVAGDSDVTNRVRKVLEESAGALVPSVRSGLERLGLLNSTLQWMVRICRPGITNEAQYLSARAHPAVFRESDFDAAKLKALAKRLTGANIPLPVRINIDYVDSMAPLEGAARPRLSRRPSGADVRTALRQRVRDTCAGTQEENQDVRADVSHLRDGVQFHMEDHRLGKIPSLVCRIQGRAKVRACGFRL